jgi:Ca-activated chloride channel family protein
VGEPRPVAREGYNIMMALDLSGSMEINDMLLHGRPASRLTVVKRAAEQFVQDRIGDRIGLILFGTRAYLQTPLTYDRHTVLMRIEDSTAGLAGKTTSIGDAVGLAVKRLEDVPHTGRIIILLTDGANNSGVLAPLKSAELAKEDGIKIYTIGLGSEADPGALTNNFLIPNASADLDEETLQKMAEMTGGRYFRATDTETLHSIYKTINQLEATTQEKATVRPQKEYYPWFVGIAIVLCFYWMARIADLALEMKALFRRREELEL